MKVTSSNEFSYCPVYNRSLQCRMTNGLVSKSSGPKFRVALPQRLRRPEGYAIHNWNFHLSLQLCFRENLVHPRVGNPFCFRCYVPFPDEPWQPCFSNARLTASWMVCSDLSSILLIVAWLWLSSCLFTAAMISAYGPSSSCSSVAHVFYPYIFGMRHLVLNMCRCCCFPVVDVRRERASLVRIFYIRSERLDIILIWQESNFRTSYFVRRRR